MITLDRATVRAPSSADERPPILRDITLSIARGERVALIGPNGAGKSTLLAVLASLRPLDGGTLTADDPDSPPRVGLLLQEPDNQLVTSSVYHELVLSLPRDQLAGDRRAPVAAASHRFGLDGMWERNPHRLSGGEKQRLALSTVWLERPDLLLLDEPTAFLDPPSARRCHEFVDELAAAGTAVVWAGPGEGDVERMDRVVCLETGTVAFDGPAERWRESDRRGAYRFPDPPRRGEANAGGVALEFDGVDFAWDDRPVLSGFQLAVARGETVGIAGENGTGKSTLLQLAGGVLKPDRGGVRRDAAGRGTGARQPVFFLPQSPERMFFAETVAEELTFGLRRLGLDRATSQRRAEDALAGVGLDPGAVMARQPFDLSYGEMRRVAFAVAGVLEPSLLLLDEPTACLDPDGVALFYRILDGYRAAGTTIMVASHDPRALGACDRVVTLTPPARP